MARQPQIKYAKRVVDSVLSSRYFVALVLLGIVACRGQTPSLEGATQVSFANETNTPVYDIRVSLGNSWRMSIDKLSAGVERGPLILGAVQGMEGTPLTVLWRRSEQAALEVREIDIEGKVVTLRFCRSGVEARACSPSD